MLSDQTRRLIGQFRTARSAGADERELTALYNEIKADFPTVRALEGRVQRKLKKGGGYHLRVDMELLREELLFRLLFPTNGSPA